MFHRPEDIDWVFHSVYCTNRLISALYEGRAKASSVLAYLVSASESLFRYSAQNRNGAFEVCHQDPVWILISCYSKKRLDVQPMRKVPF